MSDSLSVCVSFSGNCIFIAKKIEKILTEFSWGSYNGRNALMQCIMMSSNSRRSTKTKELMNQRANVPSSKDYLPATICTVSCLSSIPPLCSTHNNGSFHSQLACDRYCSAGVVTVLRKTKNKETKIFIRTSTCSHT